MISFSYQHSAAVTAEPAKRITLLTDSNSGLTVSQFSLYAFAKEVSDFVLRIVH